MNDVRFFNGIDGTGREEIGKMRKVVHLSRKLFQKWKSFGLCYWRFPTRLTYKSTDIAIDIDFSNNVPNPVISRVDTESPGYSDLVQHIRGCVCNGNTLYMKLTLHPKFTSKNKDESFFLWETVLLKSDKNKTRQATILYLWLHLTF